METESSLPSSEEATNWSYPMLAESSPHLYTLLCKVYYTIIHPSTLGLPSGLFPTDFPTKI
jgi:hypothetical protein